MDYQKTALEIARNCAAFLSNDHFVLAGDDHSDTYLDKNRLLSNPSVLEMLADGLVKTWLLEVGDWPTVIAAPAIGGALVASRVASAFEKHTGVSPIHSVFSEQKLHADDFTLYRGFGKSVRNRKVLVVDDVLTSGRAIRSTTAALQGENAFVLGVAVLFRRSTVGAEDLNTKRLIVLADVPMKSWPPNTCPLCTAGMPVNEYFGHGRRFAAVTRSGK